MSRIYVLEDDPERIVTLCRYFDRHNEKNSSTSANLISEVQWSQTASRADEFNPPYDLILLDHDLGGRQMNPQEDDNGRVFLAAIKDRIGDALVIVHSFNLGAAASMKQDYPPAVLAPFNTIEFWTLLNAAFDRRLRWNHSRPRCRRST